MSRAGDETRERILQVALPLFAEHGFAGTSIRAVSAAAEVNVATLAYHFQDKEGLYDTVVQRLHEDLAARFEAPSPRPTAEETLRAWVDAGWSFVEAHRPHLRVLVRHLLDHGSLPAVVVDRWSGPLLARADAVLAALRPDLDPPRGRLLVLTLMHVTVRLVLEDPDQLSAMTRIPRERLRQELVGWIAELATGGPGGLGAGWSLPLQPAAPGPKEGP